MFKFVRYTSDVAVLVAHKSGHIQADQFCTACNHLLENCTCDDSWMEDVCDADYPILAQVEAQEPSQATVTFRVAAYYPLIGWFDQGLTLPILRDCNHSGYRWLTVEHPATSQTVDLIYDREDMLLKI